MKTVSNSETENNELICPITLDVFRDPVIANDGHVYEREAITRWIFKRGTSPITREPLRVEELLPDDHLRCLATQRRNSTTSYNIHLNKVPLPPLQSVPPVITQIQPNQFNPVLVNHQQNNVNCNFKKCIIIIGSIILVYIIVATICVAIASIVSKSSTY
jgi:hypothetical protein